jgi:hypothetical protein
MGTVLFFAGLFAAVGVAWVIADHTPKNIDPVPIDASWWSIGAFYRGRPDRDSEVELGDRWSSVVDPGASFELSWISATRELVALRQQAHPNLRTTGGLFSALPTGLDKRATGMKVLARVDLAEVRALHPEALRGQPDGLDQLTAGLGCPYDAPHPDDPHWLGELGIAQPPDDGSAAGG